jgi:hypothetical protein
MDEYWPNAEEDQTDSVVRTLSFDDYSVARRCEETRTETLEAASHHRKLLRTLAACKLVSDNRKKVDQSGGHNIHIGQNLSSRELESYIALTRKEILLMSKPRRGGARKRKADEEEEPQETPTNDVGVQQSTHVSKSSMWDEDENVEFVPKEENADTPVDNNIGSMIINADKTMDTVESDLTEFTKEELIQKLIEYQDDNKMKDKVIERKNKQINELMGKKQKIWKKVYAKPKDRLETLLLKETRVILRDDIIHWLHEVSPHWDQYSEEEGTICYEIMSQIKQWPVGATPGFKETIWRTLLGPRLSREYTLVKNDVIQKMRMIYMSKFRFV